MPINIGNDILNIMGRFIDLTNQKFGCWKVVEKGSLDPQRKIKWKCICDCGTLAEIRGKTLRNGMSNGCRQCMPKRTKSSSPLAYRHGLSHSPTYKIWAYMIARCHNPKDTGYKWYGARGIQVCERWREDFVNFLTDMGKRPIHCSIDRIDNEKGYFKENCRWATLQEQNLNKRNSWKPFQIRNGWEVLQIFHNSSEKNKAKVRCIKCKQVVFRHKSSLNSRVCPCQKN